MRRAVARIGRKLWAALEPQLAALAKPEDDQRLDAPPSDGGVPRAMRTARRIVDGESGELERDLDSVTRLAARRADRHSMREFARLGIKIADAAPATAKLLPKWRRENVGRITGMLDDQLDKIERILADGDSMRVETLAKEIRRQCIDVSDSRAEMIARDQVLTLNAQITQARQIDAGITEYVWTTSGDERVRAEHQELEGQTFSWEDPPPVGHPGEDVMCRCVAFPILPELESE